MKIEGYSRKRELMQSVRMTSLLSIIITALLLILVFAIIVPFRLDKKMKREHFANNPNTYALVVTMYCSEERRTMYLDVLTYIRDTIGWPLKDLFIIDSANKGVPSSLVSVDNQILYDQDLLNVKETDPSPTIFEQAALDRLIESHWDRLKQYDYIIKLTGKYKFTGLLDLLRIPIREDCILNNYSDKSRFREGQIWTELIGFKSHIFRSWVNWMQHNMQDSTLETKTERFVRKDRLSPYILPRLKNDAQYERNDGSIILYL